MTCLTLYQVKVLECIEQHDGKWNAYRVDMVTFGHVSEEDGSTVWNYIEAGYVRAERVSVEPLPRLFLTEAGKKALAEWRAG